MRELSADALIVAKDRYFLENEDWFGCCTRVANTAASVEKDSNRWATEFADVIASQYFIPAGRILRNSGRSKGSLLNCYRLFIGDSIEEIGQFKKDALTLWSEGGGVGASLSNLRPKGDAILGKGGTSSGAISFARSFQSDAETIESGGSRRAAGLLDIGVNHPELLRFISAKSEDGAISHFNISVKVTEDFIQAVLDDNDWTFSFKQKSYATVKAKDVWNTIITNAINKAEPGLINWDYMQQNNSYYFAPIDGTNPCFHPDTLIETVNGRVKIKDITEPTYVYSMNTDGELCIRKSSASWLSRSFTKTMKITYSNGEIIVTPDHKLFVLGEGWVKAKDLKIGDKLNPILRQRRGAKYCGVKLGTEPSDAFRMEHRLVYEGVNGFIAPEHDVHHIDGDTYNNSVCNLESIHHSTHASLTRYSCDNDHQVKDNATGRFVSGSNSKSGVKKIVPIPENLKSNIHQWCTITHIQDWANEDVYDISVEDTHCLIANGVVAHNCGEVPLEAYGACNLGSLVLPNFIHNGRTNWSKLEEVISVAVRLLDNILDVNKFSIDKIKIASTNSRRVGIGVLGLAEYLFSKGVRYGTPEAVAVTEKIMKFIRDCAYQASVLLAVEKGAFPKFDSALYTKADFIRNLSPSLRSDIRRHGTRNCTLLAVAPTGTISLLTGYSSSIEPIFARAYTRTDRISSRNYIHPMLNRFVDGIPDWFVDSHQLSPKEHLEIQVAVQKYVDGSVSKTINLPSTYSGDELSSLLLEYILDVKGVTVYRDGSRSGQILKHMTDEEIKEHMLKEHTETLDSKDQSCASGVCEL